MKKWICMGLCLLLAMGGVGCNKKESPAPRLWLLQPSTASAEKEIQQMVRLYDAQVHVSFVPADEANMRLADAMQREDGPDVFMLYTDAIPDMAEEKQVLDLSMRLPVSKVKTAEMTDGARRACLYQGKTWGIPMFTDVYLLATNRAVVATPPQTVEQLKSETALLQEKKTAAFEKLPPDRQSLLFESVLAAQGGKMLNTARTRLAFTSQEGQAALNDCTQLLSSMSQEQDAMGNGKAAFSIMTMYERQLYTQKYPDSEIALTPLPGVQRLQTVALSVNAKTKDQKRAFALAEFLQTKGEKLATLYKFYAADKDIKARIPQDEEAVVTLSQATPMPDLCGYKALEDTYIPAAVDKAGKGVPVADALTEAAEDAAGNIWKGKRE